MKHPRKYKIYYTWFNPAWGGFDHDIVEVYGAENRDKKVAEMLASGVEYEVIKWLMFTGGWYFRDLNTGEIIMQGGHCTASGVIYEDKEIYRKKMAEKEARKRC